MACTTHTSPTWVDISTTGVVLTETLTGLTDETRYRWRARVLHAPFRVTETGITAPPNPSHGPWRHLDAQSNEADILVPEPAPMLGLAACLAWLALLHFRRRNEGAF